MKHIFKARKVNIALFIGFTVCIGGWYFFIYDPPFGGTVASHTRVLIFGHRGYGNLGLDNSFSALHKALGGGLDGIDLDAQLSADGELMIFHDPKLDRLTDGTGFLREKTLKELKGLDFQGEKIPTFEEVLQTVSGKFVTMVELKTSTFASDGSEEEAVSLIRKYNAYSHVYLSSFNPFVLYRLKRLEPKVKTVFIFKDENVDNASLKEQHPTDLKGIPFFLRSEPWRRALRKIVKPDFLSAEITVHKETIENLLIKGYPVFLWPPDSDVELKKSFARNPYGIITNEPLRAILHRPQ